MIIRLFWGISVALIVLDIILYQTYHHIADTLFWIIFPFIALGLYDLIQTKNNVLRNYPVIGHLRYLLLAIRPQIQQYYIETNIGGRPFSRQERYMVYARAESKLDALPFGTQRNVHELGFDSINHSMMPQKAHASEAKITVGGPDCKKPYHAYRLNISAMSYGALSKNAVMALNKGAKIGGFYHNTGEGGLSPYHLKYGGDIVWQIGTAYFGCRTLEGNFDQDKFKEKANRDEVKMVEIKLSQGAKPGHGGLLLKEKITPEIARIRGVPMGEDCVSPPAHTAFNTPKTLLAFIKQLRDLTDGKPIGFKLCVGSRIEFLSICKAMLKYKIYPDFITVDGAEGGTGAAPAEFTDYVGVPLDEGLVFVHNVLVGCGLRSKIRLIASGKIISGFDVICKLALGADICNSARGMLFSIGCIQSRKCHNNKCPTGVTTVDPNRFRALNVNAKAPRVASFHKNTIESFLEILGAAGLSRVSDLSPGHIYRRTGTTSVSHYDEIYDFLKPKALLGKKLPDSYKEYWDKASADYFCHFAQ